MYRLNLEEGRFLNSFQTEATTLNVCDMNPFHQLFVCGSKEGKIEAWDPRARNRVGVLDCALHAVTPDTQYLPKKTCSLSLFTDLPTFPQSHRHSSSHGRQIP